MGGKNAKPVVEYREVMNSLKRSDIAVLEAMFKRLTGQSGKTARGVDRANFGSLLKGKAEGNKAQEKKQQQQQQQQQQLMAAENSALLVDRLFTVLDSNGSGFLEFEEFVTAIFVMMFGVREYRMMVIFNCFDLDVNGQINKKEFKRMISSLVCPTDASLANINQEEATPLKPLSALLDAEYFFAVKEVDRNQDGVLNFVEWKRFADEDDTICAFEEFIRMEAFPQADVEAGAAAFFKSRNIEPVSASQ